MTTTYRYKRNSVPGEYGCLVLIIILLCAIGGGVFLFNNNSASNNNYPNQIEMTKTGFAQNHINITTAQKIYLTNSSDLAFTLCLGHNQACDPGLTTPHYLAGKGVTIPSGHTHYMSFNLGTYEITIKKIQDETSVSLKNLLVKVEQEPVSTPINTGTGGYASNNIGNVNNTDVSDGDVTTSSNSSSSTDSDEINGRSSGGFGGNEGGYGGNGGFGSDEGGYGGSGGFGSDEGGDGE